MHQSEIFVPFIGVMLLTLFVWLLMYVRRLGWIFRQKVDPRTIDTPEKLNERSPSAAANAANNLKNLFELPVIFYALCLYLFVTEQVDSVYLGCAHAFFVFRVVHSGIHCTVNKVPWRFLAYAGSAIAVWAMLVRAALQLAA